MRTHHDLRMRHGIKQLNDTSGDSSTNWIFIHACGFMYTRIIPVTTAITLNVLVLDLFSKFATKAKWWTCHTCMYCNNYNNVTTYVIWVFGGKHSEFSLLYWTFVISDSFIVENICFPRIQTKYITSTTMYYNNHEYDSDHNSWGLQEAAASPQ